MNPVGTLLDVVDKPLMAVPHTVGGVLPIWRYALYMGDTPGCDHPDWCAASSNPYIGSWSNKARVKPASTSGCYWDGWGATPVVLSTGRVLVAVGDSFNLHNNKLPYVAYGDLNSVTGAVTWYPNSATPVQVGAGIVPAIQATDIWTTGPGDTSEWIDRRKASPAIALDPTNDNVYVAFYARSSAGSGNSDIYVVRSTNTTAPPGLVAFPTNPNSINGDWIHITDAMLGIPPGNEADQVMPAIAIDSCGGVNLMFYDNRNDGDKTDATDLVDVYYVRITNFGPTGASIYQKRLNKWVSPNTPQPFPLVAETFWYLGDYHNMVSSAGVVYAAYIAREPEGPGGWSERNCYFHKIRTVCTVDLSRNSAVDAEDIGLFYDAFLNGDPQADVDQTGTIDFDDVDTFEQVYDLATGG